MCPQKRKKQLTIDPGIIFLITLIVLMVVVIGWRDEKLPGEFTAIAIKK